VNAQAMPKIDLGKIFAPQNRGILLDGVVLLFNLSLMWIITRLSLNLVQRAEQDWLAKLAIGLFFAGLFFLQPLGPVLKRWSFHQRYKEFTLDKPGSLAGCLLFWYMFVYIMIMVIVCGAASIILSEVVFERDSEWSGVGVLLMLGGFVLSFVNAVIIFRYFLTPKKEPRWKFLTTPRSELLGDVSMFLNVICFQILWGCITASAFFWESLNPTSHGQHPGFFGRTFFRFFVVAFLALLVYFPPRIFYLVMDQNRKITWLTMLLANLPLIVGIVFFSPNPAKSANMASVIPSPTFIVTAEALYKEYERDSQAAGKKYSGKYVAVTGNVQRVDLKEGTWLEPDVILDGGGRLKWVFCYFDDDQKAAMKMLKEHQRATLQGVSEKFWIGGPRLKHCVLVRAQ
jgi:hypothetical protein